ncbi:Glycosyl hydrolases family 2, TIM barrel domain [Faunimonas pinastri]|uniref:Glycosyl hydrolases family 2, TIM barrel domain n=1 Tax=Faunimonas pinastri TaxID=1855383 RepID=A0A1H9K220_9HYPH|nr:glycoside hydrolase family 2 TIM barrel-domain containing protein [Faunimonas pinastri]SEQ92875.1 Glycosyl hydrolases family 2, TIM barrel domain [Faunimonas pinastri]
MTTTAEVRPSLSLDGTWEFRHESRDGWRTTTVPGPWQAAFDDLRESSGTADYRRTFLLPADWAGREVWLRFGAVNYFCIVRVNGTEIGRHEGGYLPFEFVLPPDCLRPENQIEVTVTLPTSEADRFPDFPFPEIPHGKQSWYGPLGGIWQSVSLLARSTPHLAHCRIHADLSGGVKVDLGLSAAHSGAIRIRALGQDGSSAWKGEITADGEQAAARFHVDAPLPWSPDAPNLYRLQLELLRDGEVIDALEESFGFRRIEAREGKLFLNGEPLYLRGALDQDYYPDGICTPPSLEFLEDQLHKAKELGLNCLRCHIKVPDPRYYEVADRLGMLVWTEIPNVEQLTPNAARRLRETFEGILRRDGNHPSIIAWTLINEDWGTRLVENPEHRAWLAETFDWAKALDPTRLVVDNSACVPNFHVKTDINDYHYYRAFPERPAEWERLTEEFAGGADWTFTPHGDGTRTGEEPLIVSEFGVWGLPDPAKLTEPDGSEPFWMESGPFWGDGAAYPHAIRNRFDMLRLDRVFGTFDRFIEAVQWHQFRNLQYEIGSMRSHPSIVGYVITEFTDVHWEANGLLDLKRNPRVFHERFAEVNTDIVLVPKLERHAFWTGETIDLQIVIAAGGRHVPEGLSLRWSLAGRAGEVQAPAVAPLATSAPLAVTIGAPTLDASVNATLRLDLVASDGSVLATHAGDLALLARAPEPPSLTLACRDPELAAYLGALGYRLAKPGEADVVVARGVDADDVDAIRLGGRMLVLADGHGRARGNLRADEPPREQPFMPIVDGRPGIPVANHHYFPGLGLAERHGTMWRGDWISSFSWLKRTGAFADLPGGPLLDLAFNNVAPRHVLTGFQPWEYESRVHAGVVVGWIHKPAVTIGERPFGRGKLVASTFRLTESAPGEDPVAATLMAALIRTAAGR